MLSFCLNALVPVMLVAVFMANPSRGNSDWNQKTRDYILKIHNDRRRAEGGCHINKLEYDEDLERQAKQWAEGCVFKHELKEGRGENLAWDSNKKDEETLIKDAADLWFNEKNMYSYGQYSCGSSCHYTQMVWGETSKVGCYSTRCANLAYATANAWYFVCFYTPKGNWNGEKPYEKGCSSPCQEGQTVDNGLCVGKATNDKNQGPDEDGTCDDDQGKCEAWAKNGQCDINPGYMKLHCRKSCHLCTGDTCEDQHSNCGDWARRGECQSNPSYMEHNCKKSCSLC